MKDTIPPLTSLDRISNQVIWKGCGYSDDDMDRPIIGIANAMSDMVPGHTVLDQVARQVKYGIYRAGGTPAEFGTIACCDGLAGGHSGNNYVLPSRDNIADSIEIIARAHRLDGLVLLGSCDKIVPGMLMAAARLDLPCIFVPGGSMFSGPGYADQETSDTTSVSEAMGRLQVGEMDEAGVRRLGHVCAPTCGSCQFMGTANSMCCLAEALGMTRMQTILSVVVPQAVRRALPGCGNEIIYLIKYSSLAYLVTCIELTGEAKVLVSRTFRPTEVYFAAACYYLVMVTLATWLLNRLERKLALPGFGKATT